MFNNPAIIIRVPSVVILQVPWPDPFSSLLHPEPGEDFISLAFLVVVFPLDLNSRRIDIKRISTSPLAEVVFLQKHGSLGIEILHSFLLAWFQKLSFFLCSFSHMSGHGSTIANFWMPNHPYLMQESLCTPYSSPFVELS